uniref:Putative ovule protein n=1 Tax=Solanum chacoense TaxID=4108 RepID=A0A0V0GJI1_SOLCH
MYLPLKNTLGGINSVLSLPFISSFNSSLKPLSIEISLSEYKTPSPSIADLTALQASKVFLTPLNVVV